jgi:hypothetical protein
MQVFQVAKTMTGPRGIETEGPRGHGPRPRHSLPKYPRPLHSAFAKHSNFASSDRSDTSRRQVPRRLEDLDLVVLCVCVFFSLRVFRSEQVVADGQAPEIIW